MTFCTLAFPMITQKVGFRFRYNAQIVPQRRSALKLYPKQQRLTSHGTGIQQPA